MATEFQFRQLEDEFYRLKGQLAAGRITRDQFIAALQNLMLQDVMGRWWTINADTGRWCVNQDQMWVEAPPPFAAPSSSAGQSALPAQRPMAQPPQTRRGCGCGQLLGCGCLLLVILIVVGCGGGWVALRSGTITRDTLLGLVGQGPGDIRVTNFTDGDVHVRVTRLDAPTDETPTRSSMDLNAFDIKAHRVQEPGRYRVEFGTDPGGADAGSCVLSVRSGDDYQFIALPDKIVITRANNPSLVGADYIVNTSSLCR